MSEFPKGLSFLGRNSKKHPVPVHSDQKNSELRDKADSVVDRKPGWSISKLAVEYHMTCATHMKYQMTCD